MFSLILRKILVVETEINKIRNNQERIIDKITLLNLGDEIGGRENRQNTVDVLKDLPITTSEMLISVERKLDDDEAYRREMVN